VPILRVLVGLPASGKSTFAKSLVAENTDWVRINWDDLHKANPSMKHHDVRRLSHEQTKTALKEGKNVVVDNTNLNMKTVDEWACLGELTEAVFHIDSSFVQVPLAECISRDAARNGDRIGRAPIERMALWAGLIDFPVDKKLVLVDMDGTLADLSHRLHFINKPCLSCLATGWTSDNKPLPCSDCHGRGSLKKDWDGFFSNVIDDRPIDFVVRWVREIYADPDFIVNIVSGRPEDKAGLQTVQWLEDANVPYHHLFMRQRGDKRDDTIVKQEILDRLPKRRIAFVIDDRQSVCDMWRANGLRTIQVAEGKF
jgi:predicted kinase